MKNIDFNDLILSKIFIIILSYCVFITKVAGIHLLISA